MSPARVIWRDGVKVMTANCEAWAIDDARGNRRHFTGPDSYNAVLSELYDAGHLGAFYEARDYWGTLCHWTDRHTCGL